MKATTDLGAMSRAVHRDCYPDHDPTSCGCPPFVLDQDRGMAQRLIELLAEEGWHVGHDVALPASVPAGEPRTASAEIGDLSDRQWAVWWVLCLHPAGLTDGELADAYDSTRSTFNLPRQSIQSLRSRRAELVRAGHVAKVEGERRQTSNGGSAQVWRAVADAPTLARAS